MKIQFTKFGIRFREPFYKDKSKTHGLVKIGNIHINFSWLSYDFGYEVRDVFDDGEYVFPMFHIGPITIMRFDLN